jgi:predicted enzyme related to lactoylglutathione lyase
MQARRLIGSVQRDAIVTRRHRLVRPAKATDSRLSAGRAQDLLARKKRVPSKTRTAMSQSNARPDVAVWFEIPAADLGRAIRFYATVLEQPLKAERFGGAEIAVFPHPPGTSAGCIAHGEGFTPGRLGTLLYLNAGHSLDDALGRVFDAGGSIALPRTALPEGMGYYAHIVDTEGNKVGLHAMN